MRKAAAWQLRSDDTPKDACPLCRRTPGRGPCPIHSNPPRGIETLAFYFNLYRRRETYNALPEAGGLLDQDERTMQILDLIGREVARHRERREARAAQAARNQTPNKASTPGAFVIAYERP